jgi:hypothetical protein
MERLGVLSGSAPGLALREHCPIHKKRKEIEDIIEACGAGACLSCRTRQL